MKSKLKFNVIGTWLIFLIVGGFNLYVFSIPSPNIEKKIFIGMYFLAFGVWYNTLHLRKWR